MYYPIFSLNFVIVVLTSPWDHYTFRQVKKGKNFSLPFDYQLMFEVKHKFLTLVKLLKLFDTLMSPKYRFHVLIRKKKKNPFTLFYRLSGKRYGKGYCLLWIYRSNTDHLCLFVKGKDESLYLILRSYLQISVCRYLENFSLHYI